MYNNLVKKNISIKEFNIECRNSDLITAERFELQGSEETDDLSLVIYFAGSSWGENNDQKYYQFATKLCNISKCMVLKINLSPAPDTKFPNASSDCFDAICWVWQACAFWKINREKIYIIAEAVGANNAISALLNLRNNKSEIRIAGCIFINPLLDCRLVTPKTDEVNKSYAQVINSSILEYIDNQTRIFDKNLSLIMHEDWTRLPTILVLSGKHNLFYNDSLKLYHKILDCEGKIIFYSFNTHDNEFMYSKKFKDKNRFEKMIKTFINNNDPSYMHLVFGQT